MQLLNIKIKHKNTETQDSEKTILIYFQIKALI